jgi:hypothetical protein
VRGLGEQGELLYSTHEGGLEPISWWNLGEGL